MIPKSLRIAVPLCLGLLWGPFMRQAAAQEAVVRVPQARLRAAPRMDAAVLAEVSEGQTLTVIERIGSAWLKVRYRLPTGATVEGFIPTATVEVLGPNVSPPTEPRPPGTGSLSADFGYIDWRQRLESARSTRRTLEAVGIASGAASLLFTVLTFADKSEECVILLDFFACEEKAKTGYIVAGLVSAGVGLIASAAWYSADRRVKALELEGLRKGYPQAVIVPKRDGWMLALRWRF
ncbi:hypothetical protein HRbin11_02436 [bacterium HR11]|nr:hypothetical protein HRbin11_02436 [bacterium HR11]